MMQHSNICNQKSIEKPSSENLRIFQKMMIFYTGENFAFVRPWGGLGHLNILVLICKLMPSRIRKGLLIHIAVLILETTLLVTTLSDKMHARVGCKLQFGTDR